MSVLISLPALLADRIGGTSTVDVAAPTVTAALHVLAEQYPALENFVLGRNGAINPVIVVFLNDRQLAVDEFSSAVRQGDEIEVVPAIEGG